MAKFDFAVAKNNNNKPELFIQLAVGVSVLPGYPSDGSTVIRKRQPGALVQFGFLLTLARY